MMTAPERQVKNMRISIRFGGSSSGAERPVVFKVPGNLYSDAKCDVLVGRVDNKSKLGGVMFADCRIDVLPDGLDMKVLAVDFQIEESSKPGVGATPDRRSFFLSCRPAAGKAGT